MLRMTEAKPYIYISFIKASKITKGYMVCSYFFPKDLLSLNIICKKILPVTI